MRQIKKGSANISVDLYIIDATDGTPETGVLFDTAGIDLKYRREGAAPVNITEIALTTPALTDAHEDGGFLEIGNGSYRLDLPDAAGATGADKVTIFGTVTGMIVLPVEIQLVDNTNKDVYDRIGAAGASLSDLGGMSTGMKTEVTNAVPTVSEITSDINSNLDKTGFALSTAGILAIWHQALTAVVTAGSVGKLLKDEITAVRMAVLTDWIDAGRLDLILDAIPTTAMRGTDNAATETKQDIIDTNIDQIEATVITNAAGVDIAADIIALKTVADAIPTTAMRGTDIGDLNNLSSSDVLTAALTESYAADGSTATLSELLYMIWSLMNSLKFVTTTGTSRKLDGTTTAMTFTLDDADNPTDINRVT